METVRYSCNFEIKVYDNSNRQKVFNRTEAVIKLKSDSHLPKKYFNCFNESPLKIMENAFYFILKLFSFSRYFNFCLDFLVMQEKRLD